MNEVNEDLKAYIENNVFPEYKLNEPAHNLEHINYVIRRSFDIVRTNRLDVNPNMVYTIASYHDIGHHIDSKTHEVISAQRLLEDKNLNNFFFQDDITMMAEAIEDHRASLDREPRSIYGKIVSTADRNNTVALCLMRTYTYGKKLDTSSTDEELFHRAFSVLNNKFGVDGYAKFYFEDEEYDKFLKEIRELLEDEDEFCRRQRAYIEELKSKGIIE